MERVRNSAHELFGEVMAMSDITEEKLDQMVQLANKFLLGQLSLLNLTEFKFVENCLNAGFEELSVAIDYETRNLETELQQKANLQFETLLTFLDENVLLLSEQMKERVIPLFR